MKPDNLAFVIKVHNLAVPIVPPHFLTWCIAQAVQETGWGRAVPGNNLFGIKPVAAQSHASGRKEIRAFASWADSIRAWNFLVINSSLYSGPRERMRAHINSSWDEIGLAEITAQFMYGFVKIYCPADPKYFQKILALKKEIEAAIPAVVSSPPLQGDDLPTPATPAANPVESPGAHIPPSPAPGLAARLWSAFVILKAIFFRGGK